MNIQVEIKKTIRDVPNFPRPGIIFKDITPILHKPELCEEIIKDLTNKFQGVDAIAGIEARGFIFGMSLAQQLKVPFVPIRKAGKLPYKKIEHSYELEYGKATVEMHEDAVEPNWNVLVHDDLLATGGTAAAAAHLISQTANVCGFSFLVDLTFLNGKQALSKYSNNIYSIVEY